MKRDSPFPRICDSEFARNRSGNFSVRCSRASSLQKYKSQKELTGKDSEPSELMYFKVYKSQMPVIERAIETAALMLGSDKSRGYCLEMICTDFLAGASIDGGNPEILLPSISIIVKTIIISHTGVTPVLSVLTKFLVCTGGCDWRYSPLSASLRSSIIDAGVIIRVDL